MRAQTGHTSIIPSNSRTPTFSTPSGYLIKCYASLLEKEKGGTVPKTTTLEARVTTWYHIEGRSQKTTGNVPNAYRGALIVG